MRKTDLIAHLDSLAPDTDCWRTKNRYYHKSLERILRFHIPRGSMVIEIGCGTRDLLHAFSPACGVGIDISPAMVTIARSIYPSLEFLTGD
jgi:ubiquinone/menaquinone biosynthesis C-methylase UbiE